MSLVLPRLNVTTFEYAGLGFQYFGVNGEYCRYIGYMLQRGSYTFPDIMHEVLGDPPATVSP